MTEEKKCSNCQHGSDCKIAYEQIGCVEGPNVAVKVFMAFLLPILIFIVALVVFEDVFAMFISSDKLSRILTLLAAAAASFGCMLIMKEKKDRK